MTKRILGLLVLLIATWAHADDTPSTDFPNFFPGKDKFRLAPRTALVVGIAKVRPGGDFVSLSNPTNDADKVAQALRQVGFVVLAPHENYDSNQLTRQTIKQALYTFAVTVKRLGGVGLIYFSGHGIERNQQSYLVPYDAFLRYGRDVDEEMIPVRMFYDAFAYAGNKMNLLVVDSCRDFPLAGKLESFGRAGADDTTSAPPLDNRFVVRANSTLSGHTAIDGSDALSPYAQAFIDSLKVADAGLSGFFESIADKLSKPGLNFETPTVEIAGSHDFVFYPTEASFNRQQAIYQSGKRELLQQLTNKYAGGYFAKAAQDWLDNAPLEPPPLTVALTSPTPLRAAAGADAKVVSMPPAGEVLKVAGATELLGLKKWVPVILPSTGAKAYVDQARVTPAPQFSTSFSVRFEPSHSAGVEAVSAESTASLWGAASKPNGANVAFVEVVGYGVKKEAALAGTTQELLARQAVVVQALKDAGISSDKIVPSQREAKDATQNRTVELRFVTNK